MSRSAVLLDTHVWLWLLNGEPHLSKAVLNIAKRASQANEMFISAISLWEVSMLLVKRRIILDTPILEWLTNALKVPGINLVPLTPKIAVESGQLPQHFHGDPADRIIIATARVEGLVLITRDKKILDYGKQHHLVTLSA